MFPKPSLALARQRGFLMPVALFIVVGLGALAMAISRMGSANASNVTLAGVTAQALYAADSGGQVAAHRVLFGAQDRDQADANCSAIDQTELVLTAVGLRGCRVALLCARRTHAGGSPNRLYAIESAATCGSGDVFSARTIAVLLAFDRPE